MIFNVEVKISLKKGMLNPESSTIERALDMLGYKVENTDTIDIITFQIEEKNKTKVLEEVDNMCQRLLCNTIIHDYKISVTN